MTIHPPPIPAPELFCLPCEYRQQESIESHDDFSTEPYWNTQRIASSIIYQHHVYLWASALVRKNKFSSVLDIGCGPGIKLDRLIRPYCGDVVGVDLESAVQIARDLESHIEFRAVDLDQPRALGDRTFDLIICADVIEHLADPRVLLESIRSVSHSQTQIIISTPDRHRLRGRNSLASPMKEHIREWSVDELLLFLDQQGLKASQSRLLPFGDGNLFISWVRDLAFRLRLTDRSPLRCHTVLCSPEGA